MDRGAWQTRVSGVAKARQNLATKQYHHPHRECLGLGYRTLSELAAFQAFVGLLQLHNYICVRMIWKIKPGMQSPHICLYFCLQQTAGALLAYCPNDNTPRLEENKKQTSPWLTFEMHHRNFKLRTEPMLFRQQKVRGWGGGGCWVRRILFS